MNFQSSEVDDVAFVRDSLAKYINGLNLRPDNSSEQYRIEADREVRAACRRLVIFVHNHCLEQLDEPLLRIARGDAVDENRVDESIAFTVSDWAADALDEIEVAAVLNRSRQVVCNDVLKFDGENLFLGQDVIAKIGSRAKNLRPILLAFEEEGWPGHIDDPLPPQDETDPKARLRETIRTLNEKQDVIIFSADGTGEGVEWTMRRDRMGDVRESYG